MSSVLDALAAAPRRISMEVVPPSRGGDPDGVIACVEALAPFEPAFVSVTDHPAGHAWAERDGAPVAVPIRGKPGTLGLCVAIRERTGATVVPHLVCLGSDRFKAEDQLIDLRYAGFTDVFVVRGDERFSPFASPGTGTGPGAPGVAGYGSLSQAVDLVRIVAAINRGDYLSDGSKGSPAGFSVGVAAYPEKHPASPNPEADLASLREKVQAGASWIATQMVFDAGRYADFVGRARAAGIEEPIIPGLKPLVRARSLAGVPGTFFVDVPRALVDALTEARSPAEERLAGIRYAAALVGRLYDAGAPCIHFFTMGKARDAVETLEAVFGGASGAAR
jgi:methylenetetrahydrofolate reductase (NADPH)